MLLDLVVKIVLQHYPPESGHVQRKRRCLLRAKSGHWRVDLLGWRRNENALRGLKEWQRLVPKSAACRVDYLDFWNRLSSLSTPIPGTDSLPVP
jgi:hypothetical protein